MEWAEQFLPWYTERLDADRVLGTRLCPLETLPYMIPS